MRKTGKETVIADEEHFSRYIQPEYRAAVTKLLESYGIPVTNQILAIVTRAISRGYISEKAKTSSKTERSEFLEFLDLLPSQGITSATFVSKGKPYKFKRDEIVLSHIARALNGINSEDVEWTYKPAFNGLLPIVAKVFYTLQGVALESKLPIKTRQLRILTFDILALAYPKVFIKPSGAQSYNDQIKANRIASCLRLK